MLAVPQVTKNLLSVRRLCVDNNVDVNFDEHGVKVRDRATK